MRYIFIFIVLTYSINTAALQRMDFGKFSLTLDHDLKSIFRHYKNNLTNSNNAHQFEVGIKSILEAHGYFDYSIKLEKQHFTVKTSSPYIIKKVNLYLNNKLINHADVKILTNQFVNNQKIEAFGNNLFNDIQCKYCLFKPDYRVEAEIFRKNKSVIINYYVNGIANSKFDQINIKNKTGINNIFLLRHLPIKPQQCYNLQSVEQARIAMLKTNLFNNFNIKNKLNTNNKIISDIDYQLAKNKMIELSSSFGSDQKIDFNFVWENKNFRQHAELVRFKLNYNKKRVINTLEYNLPFYKPNQQINNEIKITKDQFLNYKEHTAKFKSLIINNITSDKLIKYGFRINRTKFDNNIKSKTKSNLLALITGFEYNRHLKNEYNRNFSLDIEPVIIGNSSHFIKTKISFANLQKISNLSHNNVLLNNIELIIGSIISKKPYEIIETEKYFLGGVNSIRGYEYKSVGINKNNTIIGGTSYITLKNEFVIKRQNNWAAGIFFDMASVASTKIPSTKNLITSTGITVKYFISNIPISFDIAFPLKKQYNRKKKFQFYISVGKAF